MQSENELLFNDLNLSVNKVQFVTPFRKEFYAKCKNVKHVHYEDLVVLKNSIVEINEAFTLYQGEINGEPVLVQEFFEDYSSLRQTQSLMQEITALE